MPVTLTITADTLAEALAQFYGSIPPRTLVEPPPDADHEWPEARSNIGATPEPPTAGALTAEARKRGRPKATPAQEAARFKPAEGAEPKPKPEPEAEPSGPVYTVRRYGGMIHGEYADSGSATQDLLGLISEAGDVEALEALVVANDGIAFWPQERRQVITNAVKSAHATLASATPAHATPAPQHFALNGAVLGGLTPDKQGAMDGVNAVVAAEGGAGGGGYAAAKAFMESLGVARVSKLDDGDPNLGKIAAWCAARLGLPVVLIG